MCLTDLLTRLRKEEIVATESQIRWAIKTLKVSRPKLDGSLRFDFSEENVAELIHHFQKIQNPAVV